MKWLLAFLLTLGVILPAEARHGRPGQLWSVLFTGGQVDPNGHALTTTEVRTGAGHVIPNGLTMPDGTTCSSSSAGSWNGTGCVIWAVGTGTETDPAHTPGMVMIWSKSPKSGGVPYRDLLMQTGDNQNTLVYDKCWLTDASGSVPTGGTFCTIVSSPWRQDGSTTLRAYWRNDHTPGWGYTTVASGEGGIVGPQFRGGAAHEDFVLSTPVDFMFLAGEPYGPFKAALNTGTTATSFCGGTGCGSSTITYTLEGFNGCLTGVEVCTNLATDWAGCTGESLAGVTLFAAGSGYTNGDNLTFVPGVFNTAAVAHVTGVNGSGGVTSFSMTSGGGNVGSYLSIYSSVTWTTTGGSGTGAKFTNSTFTSLNGAACPIFPGGSQIRPMAMADVTIGAASHPTLCVSIWMEIWCRTDGATPTWTLKWLAPAADITAIGNSQSGLRGLTAIPNPTGGSGQYLFMTTEGGPDFPYSCDPTLFNGTSTGCTNEKPSTGLIGVIKASPLWGGTDYNYTITSYNQLIGTWNQYSQITQTSTPVLVWGFGAIYYTNALSQAPPGHAHWMFHRITSTLDSAAWFMTRTLGVSPVYTIYSITNITPQSQISARWCAPSVFPDSQSPSQALDCMGVDANQATQVNTGWVEEFGARYPPIVTSVSPNHDLVAGGTSITIIGQNFTTGEGFPLVNFGSTPATGIIFNSSTSITATDPAHVPGNVPVTVITGTGASVP